MGHYYDCPHCGVEDHNHTCPGKESYTKRIQAKYAKMSIRPILKHKKPKSKPKPKPKEKESTRYHRRALDLGD